MSFYRKPLPYNKFSVSPAEQRTVDGITFASKKEKNRYLDLKLIEKAGQIKNLVLQPKFEIIPAIGKFRTTYYVADFMYDDTKTGKTVVEEVKGFETPAYKLKAHLFVIRYPEYEYFVNTT